MSLDRVFRTLVCGCNGSFNYGMEDLAEEIYDKPNACGAKKLAKQVATEASWDEEKLEAMKAIIRAKSKCVQEYRRRGGSRRQLLVIWPQYTRCPVGKQKRLARSKHHEAATTARIG